MKSSPTQAGPTCSYRQGRREDAALGGSEGKFEGS